MGQELFVRGKKGKRSVELTRAGKVFLPYAEQVIETINTAKSEIHQNVNDTFITLGSSIALTHPYIYGKINMLNNVHNKNINLLIMDHSLIAKSLLEGVVDMAFVTEPIINKQLESQPIYKENYGLIVSAKHPLARKKCLDNLEDLEDQYLIFYKSFLKDQTFFRNIKCEKWITTNQVELVNDLIQNQNAVSFLPSHSLNNEIQRGKLAYVPIHKDLLVCDIQYFLVYRKNELFYEDIFLQELEPETLTI
ncbi:hypothetical protein AM1BK_27980 [Neobacillus kokaensis]|uniref:LysR substrate-binding domain-containing protein n=1 Tax=Neobacillus kokaensis TaxID=2759023 RepID=A0ABQ3N5X7_9BACI|nr:hypothetical protein AM1BK_27980 [Neobacillus kokaensis]